MTVRSLFIDRVMGTGISGREVWLHVPEVRIQDRECVGRSIVNWEHFVHQELCVSYTILE
jgi:hypothetical protein